MSEFNDPNRDRARLAEPLAIDPDHPEGPVWPTGTWLVGELCWTAAPDGEPRCLFQLGDPSDGEVLFIRLELFDRIDVGRDSLWWTLHLCRCHPDDDEEEYADELGKKRNG